MIAIEVDDRTAEALLGRKLTALDRFLGLATNRAIRLVEGNMKGRVKLLKRPQNIQDATRRTQPSTNPIRSRLEATGDGVIELRPHLTSARSPAIQKLFVQLGIGDQLTRKGLWMDPKRFIRGPGGRFMGSKRNNGYKSRDGLRFSAFEEKVKIAGSFGFSRVAGKSKRVTLVRAGLRNWAEQQSKGTQRLRHTVRLGNPDALIKLVLAPTVKFTRDRVAAIFGDATKKAMEIE